MYGLYYNGEVLIPKMLAHVNREVKWRVRCEGCEGCLFEFIDKMEMAIDSK